MDIREMLIDGVSQMNEWLDEALEPLTTEQLNHLPEGKTTSIGFNAWHVMRTQDNITNFVCRGQMPLWVDKGYFEQFGLPKVDQGTGMTMDDARGITIKDVAMLREYGKVVGEDCVAFLKDVPMEELEKVQMIKPLGEMPKAKVFRQVVMTHGFMHLGEVNHMKGVMGLHFSI